MIVQTERPRVIAALAVMGAVWLMLAPAGRLAAQSANTTDGGGLQDAAATIGVVLASVLAAMVLEWRRRKMLPALTGETSGQSEDEGEALSVEETLAATVVARLAQVEAECKTGRADRETLSARLAAQERELAAVCTELERERAGKAKAEAERDDALARSARLEVRVSDLERSLVDLRVQVKAYELLFDRLDIRNVKREDISGAT